ncbi:MAG: LamG domain-containing protein [Magnetococcales bacterium]|nr:LamG domain-containing protein [Magnetococcales bacterium]
MEKTSSARVVARVASAIRHPAAGSMLLWVSFGMVALGSVIATSLPRMSGLVNRDKATANEKVILEVRNAIEGFAAANRRLPCPDTNGSGLEVCPLTSTTNPSGKIPYRTLGLSSANDSYGNPYRYATYVDTIGSTAATTADLTATTHTSSTFCSALNSATIPNVATRLSEVDSAGANGVNVPFVVVSPGPKDANGNNTNGLLDGNNETLTVRYDYPSRVTNSTYDDRVIDSNFDRNYAADATHTAPFKALMTRLFPSGCSCSGSTVSDPLSTGQMVAFYKLEDTPLTATGDKICDSSGNNNSGSFTTPLSGQTIAVPTLVANRFATTSKAMDFANSGSTNNGVVLPEATLNSVANGTFSISFWAYPTSNSSGTLISGYGSSSNQFNISRNANGNNQPLTVTIKGSTTITSGSTNFNQNSWYHVVLTRDGSSGTASLYINGTATGSNTSATGSMAIATNGLTLGFVSTGAAVSNNWKGRLDDLIIYSVVLNSTQVNTLYTTQNAASP